MGAECTKSVATDIYNFTLCMKCVELVPRKTQVSSFQGKRREIIIITITIIIIIIIII
jgi:hypothetical protein